MKLPSLIKSIKIVLIATACAFCGFEAYARSVPAEQIYDYARHRDYTALKYLGSNLEAEDGDGNTAVCLALKNGDRTSYSVLVNYGANPHPRCERRLSLRRYDASGSSVSNSSSTTWIMAAALVAGGVGIAAAAAGGGGGSKGSGGSDGPQRGNCDGYMSECTIGYEATGKTCIGHDGKTYFECVPTDCSGYDLGAVPENCDDFSACRSGNVVTYKCNNCKEGWHGKTCENKNACLYHTTECSLPLGYVETGEVCYEGDNKYIECKPNPCEGYDLVPPHNMETCNNFSTCRSGEITKYKCEACNEGWNGTTCNDKNICDYDTTECIPENGYVETGNICYEGYNKYTECKPRDCSDYPFYKEPTTHCDISESCKPGKEQLKWRCSLCEIGWEGDDCSIMHQCPYSTTECLEEKGYVATGNDCWSGSNHYIECKPVDCSDYPLESIPEHCASTSSCRSADVTTYLCNSCQEGWEGSACDQKAVCPYDTTECLEEKGYVETGRTCKSGYDKYIECMPNPCDGYTLETCPADAIECETCLSGKNTLYKVKQCREGWTGVDCGVPKECEGFTLECEEGYIFPPNGEVCRYGDIEYKKCKPRECRPEYKYLECPAGYDEKDTCQSGETIYKECEEHPCEFHTTECKEGYIETGNTCQSGDNHYVECKPAECVGFTLERCPPHAQNCNSCKSGETIRYQITKCYPGWTGDDCNEPSYCPYSNLSCDGSKGEIPTGKTCESGGKTYIDCTNRECMGFSLVDSCPTDKVRTCEKCVSGGTDYYKAKECAEGWTNTGNYCEDPVECGDDYKLLTCPEHADCHHCMSGTTKWLKIYACKVGYEPNSEGTQCVEKEGIGTSSVLSLMRSPRRVGAYYSKDKFEHTEDIVLNTAENVTAIGIYAEDASVINNARIEIKKPLIEDSEDESEIVEDESQAVNNKPEIVNDKTPDMPAGYAIGMYATSGSTVVNNGKITIDGAQIAVGMYGEDGNEEMPTIVENAGTIEITNSDKAYGIWAEGENVIVKNTGTIKIDEATRNDECTGANCGESSYAIVLNGGVLFQNGLLQAQSFNTEDIDGMVTASSDARFEIENELSGDLTISTDVVTNGFEDTYTVDNMIDAGDVSGLNLLSQSALFDAELQNESDAVLTMKSFNEVVQNQSVAEFLHQNYDAGNNEELFNLLKEKDSLASLNAAVNTLTADDVFNRFNFEDMTMMRELNADVNNKLFNNNAEHLTTSGSVAPFYFESGMGSNARYALYSTRIGRKSFGLSMAFSNVSSSDRHDRNSRKDETFQMSVPLGYNRYGFKFITAPRFGYAYGTYDRNGYNRTYDGTVEKRMMGLMNETRYPIDMGGWSLSPAAEFNMLGYHIKGHEDRAPFALNIKSQNNYSVEAGLGLYANKNVRFGHNQRLQMHAGVAAYHEFADPYTTELEMQDMNGSFKVRDARRKDNRAVVRAGFDYNFGSDFSLIGAIASFVDGTTHTNANLDFKYHF